MEAKTALRERIAELADLRSAESLLFWDQLVMMPAAGAASRAEASGTLARLIHERATAQRVGEWLAELDEDSLDGVDRDIVRLARRDFDRASRVPDELAAARAEASVAGQQVWQAARADDDFAAFLPALERNLELAREYAAAVAGERQTPYDALVDDFDYGLTAERIGELFGGLVEVLPGLVAEAPATAPPALSVPVDVQRDAVSGTLARLGVEPTSWRVDVSAHPFSVPIGVDDSRVTTRYADEGVDSLIAALHEYGHSLFDRQIPRELKRTNLASGLSMSVHESQSKLWENHVARDRAFAEVISRELREAGAEVSAGEYHAVVNHVAASPIRVSSDPVSYPLHIVLRFELERAMVEGELAAADLPEAWRAGMRRLLGIEVESDALGCLQDVHWSAGSFGYFPTYAVGCLIAAQLFEALVAALGPLDERLRNADVADIQAWLRDNVHRYGRRLDTLPLVEAASGTPLAGDAFMRFVRPLAVH